MSLSKKHFIRIAEIIKKGRIGSMEKVIYNNLAIALADYFVEENPLFNRQKFLKACGVNGNT